MNDESYAAWLRNPAAVRLVLVEVAVRVAGVETTRYLSTGGYNSAPTDTPANTHYLPIVSTGVQFTEQLSLSGEASLSAGDIELHNPSGVRDGWLDDVWVNRPLKAWIGDPRWPRADFQKIFDGVVADIAPKGRDKLGLKLRDKLQRLNTPVSERKLGGASPNKDALLPLAFGEVHNLTPLLVDPGQLQYQVHDGACENLFEVRDNGLPVNAVVSNGSGTFKLSQSPAGAVTVSAQGDQPGVYANTVAGLVRRLVTGYGKASDRFGAADLDEFNLGPFDEAHAQPVGLFLSGRTNVLNACQMLASSLGAQILMSRSGKLRLIQIALPEPGAPDEPVVIGPQHMRENTLTATSRTDVAAAVKIGFGKNWTVQPGLQTALPAQHKELFATEWLTATVSSNVVQQKYRLDAEPVQRDTMLLRRVDAQAEADRQQKLWSVPRTIYEFEGTADMLALELGQAVMLYNRRYNMSAGVRGIVVSLAPDWSTAHCKVGVLV